MARYEIVVEDGAPRGDLYELEQTTYFHVVDRLADRVIMTFRGEMEASLSRENGMWDNYHYAGVREVIISADEQSISVRYYNGREEKIALPV